MLIFQRVYDALLDVVAEVPAEVDWSGKAPCTGLPPGDKRGGFVRIAGLQESDCGDESLDIHGAERVAPVLSLVANHRTVDKVEGLSSRLSRLFLVELRDELFRQLAGQGQSRISRGASPEDDDRSPGHAARLARELTSGVDRVPP